MVQLARSTLDLFVMGRPPRLSPNKGFLSELRGVFVTLNGQGSPEERLRGCIGFPYPSKELGVAVIEATIAAASEDPRFPPVRPPELTTLKVEVSVLTPPAQLKVPKLQVSSQVKIGRDGLIISRGHLSGLLLPQVATEFGLDQEEFLSQACLKAGLAPDSWLDPQTRVQTFQAEIFTEEKPRGRVVRVNAARS